MIFASMLLLFGMLVMGCRATDLTSNLTRDASLTAPELVAAYGYPVETHTVQTQDGYLLAMHRIPAPGKRPVYVQHGILSSSADWVLTKPSRALAYALSDAGYDVWLGNFRGDTYSMQHVNYTIDDSRFWDYTWHENGIYDLPAMIDYVLKETNSEKLTYMGHSMGTTAFYVMASLKPEYNQKIEIMFSMAPIAFMNHVTSPLLRWLSIFYPVYQEGFPLVGLKALFENSPLVKAAAETFCSKQDITQIVCTNILFLVAGYDQKNINTTELPVLLSHSPAGASGGQLIHYSQLILSGHFRQYDYGFLGNLLHYSSISPPDYDLTKITSPIYLIHADNDWISSIVDVQKLQSLLPNVVGSHKVQFQDFNHIDYCWGLNAKEEVYNVMIDVMSKL